MLTTIFAALRLNAIRTEIKESNFFIVIKKADRLLAGRPVCTKKPDYRAETLGALNRALITMFVMCRFGFSMETSLSDPVDGMATFVNFVTLFVPFRATVMLVAAVVS